MRWLALFILLIPGSIPLILLYTSVRLFWAAVFTNTEETDNDEN